MAMPVKQVLYRYNGNDWNNEFELDMDGSVPSHITGDMIMRNGKLWGVSRTLFMESSDPADAPVMVIDLFGPFIA
jgi:hypothetical protein